MKAFKHLIKHALKEDCTVSVWDGEEFQVSKSTSYKAIVDAVESVDEAQLHIRKDGEIVGWALVSAFGLEDDETVMDHSVNDFMEGWSALYA